MPFDVDDNLLLLPGPVKVHPRVARAFARPTIGHRSPEFKETIKHLTTGMRYLFQTKNDVVALTGSATLGMEAVIAAVATPADKVLVLSNGKFGERFSELAKAYAGEGAEVIASPMGTPLDLERAEARLAQGGVKAVAVVLNESSTGMQNPGANIADLCKKHDVLFLADAVTAAGGMEVPVDRWGIDACIVGSQKCLGAPAGATLISVSPDFLSAARPRGLYLDLVNAVKQWSNSATPFTPSVPLYTAVAEALDMLAEETLEQRIARTERLAAAFRRGLAALQLSLVPPPAFASNTVSAVRYPAGVTDKAIREVLKQEFGIVVSGGQGELEGKCFRVGHMGYVQPRELIALLGALEGALARTSHVVARGAGVTAFVDAWLAN